MQNFSSARDGALRILLAVEREGAYANLALQKLTRSRRLNPAEMALLTELAYGTLRLRNTLDWVIGKFSKVPVERLNYVIRNILRLAVYQLLFLERVPAAAVCNESVNLARKWRLDSLAGFVNGVLRNIVRHPERIEYPSLQEDPVLHISVKYSHPAWLVERWLRRFGEEETIALCRTNNMPPPLVLRCNTLKASPEQLRKILEEEGISARPSPLIPEGLRVSRLAFLPDCASFREGFFVVQDESSMLASLVLNPQPGSFVVDACSGPGGKTSHLAQIMKNKGRVLALDIHEHRLRLVQKTCLRLGISIVETSLLDARFLPEELWGRADYLLVDAPCSGLGVIRRRPDLRWRVCPEELVHHAQAQLAILEGAGKCLKKGGVLVYSTCSTEPEENLEVVTRFLTDHPDFEPQEIVSRLPFPLVYDEDRVSARAGHLQLLPHRHGTDGFFLACLKKTSEEQVRRWICKYGKSG
ncbi:MAG: 16S rRNA (cytosine(967)-C(5))-methyltransferase RsmB [Firmicutes bacterium]|nr:16S rRNA (cytosine(967)-C(5))-methyltransferase RsmB [Bacillota bacterium]